MNEIILIGQDLYKKIDELEVEYTDPENWLVFYIDKLTNEKWVKEYPHSEMHGGGAPQLRLINFFPWEKQTNNNESE